MWRLNGQGWRGCHQEVREGRRKWVAGHCKVTWHFLREASHQAFHWWSKEANVEITSCRMFIKMKLTCCSVEAWLIPALIPENRFLLWVLIKRTTQHSAEHPPGVVLIVTSMNLMSLFVRVLQCRPSAQPQGDSAVY